MNVKELLESRDIPYKESGKDCVIRCLNPEHEDRNPSMRIDKTLGIFRCMSCNYKGNLFVLFGERYSPLQAKRERLKSLLNLKRAEGVGLQPPSSIVPYDGNWRNISPETYEKFEAFTCHEKDYVGRIVFPIRDITGKICAFQGRHTTGGEPKYLNSPPNAKLPLYPKIRPYKGTAILVEGIFDVLNLWDKGIHNTVACFGAGNVSADKLSILKLQGVSTLYTFLDGDKAGQEAVQDIKSACNLIDLEHKNIYVEGKDPGELSLQTVKSLKNKIYGEQHESSNY